MCTAVPALYGAEDEAQGFGRARQALNQLSSSQPSPNSISSFHDRVYAMEIMTIMGRDQTHGFSCNPLRASLLPVNSTESGHVLYSLITRESPVTYRITRMSPGTNLATDMQPTWESPLEPQGRDFLKQTKTSS